MFDLECHSALDHISVAERAGYETLILCDLCENIEGFTLNELEQRHGRGDVLTALVTKMVEHGDIIRVYDPVWAPPVYRVSPQRWIEMVA